MAFSLFLALVPGLAAAISLYGLVSNPVRVGADVRDTFAALPPAARGLLEDQLTRIVDQSGGTLGVTLVVSVALALWAASAGFRRFVEAIGMIHDRDEDRGFVRLRLVSLGLTLGAVLSVGAIAWFMAAAPGWISGHNPVAQWVIRAVVWIGGGFVLSVGVSVLYDVALRQPRRSIRPVTRGALVAVGILVAASVLLQIYVAHFGSYQKTYGPLAAVVLLLIWLNLVALAVLIGAHVNQRATPPGAQGRQ